MILKDCEGVCIEIDDILVHGKDTKEHDERLKKVLQKLEEANVTLNGDKCEFSKPEVHYLGHVINATGISADPKKFVPSQRCHRQTEPKRGGGS
jgi:hypothetical protein